MADPVDGGELESPVESREVGASLDGGPITPETVPKAHILPQNRKPHDPTVSFAEYRYYAKLTRAEEDTNSKSDIGDSTFISFFLPPKNLKGDVVRSAPAITNGNGEKVREGGEENIPSKGRNIQDLESADRLAISDDEWTNASRAVRTATWAAIFYLITTDILGPFNVPFAMGTLGWGPGIALYTVFGILAVYGGWLLYFMFLGLDSFAFPMRTYGDIAFRVYGTPMRHMVNILQSIQLLFNVGVIIVSNGQALSEVSKFKLCYAVCCLVFALAGFFIGQVRTLQKYGWLANAAIWINVFVIIETMAIVPHEGPLYAAVQASAGTALGGDLVTQADNGTGAFPPVVHFAGLPPDSRGFTGALNGLMQAVYAYGGAMLFIEFMSEMKRPRDFWKGMICAQSFIYFVYIFYGCFLYAYQGQYAINPSFEGVSIYAWQTVGNIMAFLSALIAAGLYGNIGVKVLYNNIFIDFLGVPPLSTLTGKLIWMAIIPVYWSCAYIVSAAIPNFFGLSALVASLCILQFTYTFPPMLYLGYAMKVGAELPGEGFNPATGEVIQHDRGPKRWLRGFWKNKVLLNTWHLIFFLGALVTAGLGAYSAIIALKDAFEVPQITAFTCHSPLDNST